MTNTESFLECVLDIRLSLYAPIFAAEFNLLDRISGKTDENLRYIELETGAEVAAVPKKPGSTIEILLCTRHGSLETLKAACDLIDRLMETVIKDVKNFLRNHDLASGASDFSDDILDIKKTFQCGLCACTFGNSWQRLKDHVRSREHLECKERGGKQAVTSDSAILELHNYFRVSFKQQSEKKNVTTLQDLVETEARRKSLDYRADPYPQTKSHCMLCSVFVDTPDQMKDHLKTTKHRMTYLNLQLKLGLVKFSLMYSSVPLPGVPTDGGRWLAAKVIEKDIVAPVLQDFTNDEHYENYKRMLILSCWVNENCCKICDTKVQNYSDWAAHMSGMPHARNCVRELLDNGKEQYTVTFNTIPAPMPGKVTRDMLDNIAPGSDILKSIFVKEYESELQAPAETSKKEDDRQKKNEGRESENTLYVKNIKHTTTSDALYNAFREHADIEKPLVVNKANHPYAFVKFKDPAQLDKFLEKPKEIIISGLKIDYHRYRNKDSYDYKKDEEFRKIDHWNNLSQDAAGLYALTFINKDKSGNPFLKDFEEIYHAFKRFGEVKDIYQMQNSGRTFIRYGKIEEVVKACKAMKTEVYRLSIPSARANAPGVSVTVQQKIKALKEADEEKAKKKKVPTATLR